MDARACMHACMHAWERAFLPGPFTSYVRRIVVGNSRVSLLCLTQQFLIDRSRRHRKNYFAFSKFSIFLSHSLARSLALTFIPPLFTYVCILYVCLRRKLEQCFCFPLLLHLASLRIFGKKKKKLYTVFK